MSEPNQTDQTPAAPAQEDVELAAQDLEAVSGGAMLRILPTDPIIDPIICPPPTFPTDPILLIE